MKFEIIIFEIIIILLFILYVLGYEDYGMLSPISLEILFFWLKSLKNLGQIWLLSQNDVIIYQEVV